MLPVVLSRLGKDKIPHQFIMDSISRASYAHPRLLSFNFWHRAVDGSRWGSRSIAGVFISNQTPQYFQYFHIPAVRPGICYVGLPNMEAAREKVPSFHLEI